MQKSYLQHNSEYVKTEALDNEIKGHLERDANVYRDGNKYLYISDMPHGKLLDDNPEIKIAVDIGSGTGWFANHLVNSRNYKLVHAIEPSSAAIAIANKIYPNQDKVNYINGFADQELEKIKFTEPVFFSTMTVFAHLEENEIIPTLEVINENAPVGSVFAFSEPWGDTFNYHLWNIRTKEWWESKMSNWKFTFSTECEIPWPNNPTRFKGFFAKKEI